MAKDTRTSSKRSDQGPKRRKSASDFRASHRVHSAASAERKKAAGFVRLSVWVPYEHANTMKHVAKCLCNGHDPAHIADRLAAERKLSDPYVTPTRRTEKRKNQPCDDRQMDLFGPG